MVGLLLHASLGGCILTAADENCIYVVGGMVLLANVWHLVLGTFHKKAFDGVGVARINSHICVTKVKLGCKC